MPRGDKAEKNLSLTQLETPMIVKMAPLPLRLVLRTLEPLDSDVSGLRRSRRFQDNVRECQRLLKFGGLSPYGHFAAFSQPFCKIQAVMAMGVARQREGEWLSFEPPLTVP